MILLVDETLSLEQIHRSHASELYQLAEANRGHLRPWLPWVDAMESVAFIEAYISGSAQRFADGAEVAFVIKEDNRIIGRIGVYNINPQNSQGEIGYWLAADAEGKGIATKCCKALIRHCFETLLLNRIEIKCNTANVKSQRVPQRLGFTEEGILQQAEWLHGAYGNLKLYALLKDEWRLL